jgi:DUF971 family protein
VTPKELHETCHEAAMQCPQFQGYDDDQNFLLPDGRSVEFGDIPKKGYAAVIQFWKEEKHLFEFGYFECLPPDVQQMFDEIDAVIAKAIKDYFK